MTTAGYIYRTTNRLNGKVYIGMHRRTSFNRQYIGSGIHFLRAVKKDGRTNFSVECLEFAATPLELNLAEQRQIIVHRSLHGRENCYNITDGGDGGKGWKMTEEEKDRRRVLFTGNGNPMFGVRSYGSKNGHFGKHHSGESKMKIGDRVRTNSGSAKAAKNGNHWLAGKKWTDEEKARLIGRKPSNLGRKFSKEVRDRMSAARKKLFEDGYKNSFSPETRRKISEGRKRYWSNLPSDKMETVKERGRQRMKNPAFALKFRHTGTKHNTTQQQEFNL